MNDRSETTSEPQLGTHQEVSDENVRVAVALSGGGYRAAAFGAGVFLCLSDLGRSHTVAAVASVSGGSLTNAFFTAAFSGSETQNAETWERAKPLLGFLAHRDIISIKRMALISAASAIAIGAAGSLIATGGFTRVVWAMLSGAATFVIVFWLFFRLLGKSFELAVDWLLAEAVTNKTSYQNVEVQDVPSFPRRMPLASLHASYVPMFCCTDLLTSTYFAISPQFVIAAASSRPDSGVAMVGIPGQIDLARAVAASTAFPFIFRPKRIQASALGLADLYGAKATVLLADGGLYDNLGVDILSDWILHRLPLDAEDLLGNPPEFLVVVDSGEGNGYSRPTVSVIRSGARALKVVHQANRMRARAAARQLVAETSPGAVITIGQNPYELANNANDEATRRDALEWLDAFSLHTGLGRADWTAMSRNSPAIRTGLHSLGRRQTAKLVLHGYALTATWLRIALGSQPPPVSSLPLDLADLFDNRSSFTLWGRVRSMTGANRIGRTVRQKRDA